MFIHSSLGGHLDCFHLLATVHNSAIDIHVPVFVFVFFLMRAISKVSVEFVTIPLLFHLLAFWTQASQLPYQRSDLPSLNRKAKSQPLDLQGSPMHKFLCGHLSSFLLGMHT